MQAEPQLVEQIVTACGVSERIWDTLDCIPLGSGPARFFGFFGIDVPPKEKPEDQNYPQARF